MRTLRISLLMLCIAGLGCRAPWEPKFGLVTGTERYADKTPAYMAQVSVVGQGATYTDMLGHNTVERGAATDTVAVGAREGYEPGRTYAVIRLGGSRVAVRSPVTVVNIVLDHEVVI